MLEPGDELVELGQWQALPGQSPILVNPGDFVCSDCMAVCSRGPCIVCTNPTVPDDDHYLLTGFSVSHGRAGNTDKRISTSVTSSSTGPPAEPLPLSTPLSTPSNSDAPARPRRCFTSSAISEQPSSASSPAYHSATEDISEVSIPVAPPASSITLNQTQVEIVGIPDQKAGFYAIGVTTRPRIVYGSWVAVAPLTTGPTAHRVTPSRHFKVEADALGRMVAQGFSLPHYVLSGALPTTLSPALETTPSPPLRRELVPADGNGPMVTVTQGPTSHLSYSSAYPPSPPVPRAQVAIPTSLKNKVQQERAIWQTPHHPC